MIGPSEARANLLNRCLFISVVLIGVTNSRAQESSVDIETVRSIIGTALESVDSLKLNVEVLSPSTVSIQRDPVASDTVSESRKPTVRTFFWAFQFDGKECLSAFPEYQLGTEPPNGRYTVAFNGESLRTLSEESSQSEPQGFILPLEELESSLKDRAAYATEVGRAWGRSINGFSLEELLNRESAHALGQIPFGNVQSFVVEIPYTLEGDSDWSGKIRLYLSEEMNYAILGWESYQGDRLQIRLTNEAFQEILPGVWFPTKGIVEPIDRKIGGYTLQPITFQVISIEANTTLPPELFEVEFPAGTRITDSRVAK